MNTLLKPSNLAQLERMEARLKEHTLFGAAPDGRTWNAHLADELKATREATDIDPKMVAQKIQRAMAGDIDARQELRELRVIQTTNYLLPTLNFGRFFEVVVLQPNQSPAIQNNTRQQISASYIGQDGETQTVKVIKPQAEAVVDLHELVSDEVTWVTRDLYTGDVSEAARATFDIGFDLRNQTEGKAVTLLTDATNGAYVTFNTTAANKASRDFHLNSRIRSGVLPTTNSLDIASIGASTTFGFTVFDKVIEYCLKLTGTDPEGDLAPTGEVIVPADEIIPILSSLTKTGARLTDLAERIIQQGWMGVGEYGGVNWTIIPDNTIAQGTSYPRLNKPVGILFLKPSMDDSEETYVKKYNRATRWEKKVLGLAIPSHRRKNAVKVRFHT